MLNITVTKKMSRQWLMQKLTGLENNYGRVSELMRTTKSNPCSNPSNTDDLMIWSTLMQSTLEEVEYTQEYSYFTTAFFEALTPKRAEILEMLSHEKFGSIQDLAQRMDRDYKNVYDDLKILERYGLIERRKKGRGYVPISDVERILIRIK